MKNFLKLFLRKLLSYAITLCLLVTFIFFIIRITPGDPAAKYISPQFNKELADNVRASYNLNEPLLSQFGAFLGNALSGNFGISYEYHQPVFSVVKNYLLFTVLFALTSFLIQFAAGTGIALYVTKRRGSRFEKIFDSLSLAVYSLPTFLIGVILVYIFSIKLNIFPSSDLYSPDFSSKSIFEKIFEIISHSILPLLTLSIPGIVIFYRYAKENLTAALNKSFVTYLRSNGMGEKEIYRKHILPNIMPQLISLSAVELSILLSGALITEVIFNLPGMGRVTVTAIMQRDYPLIVATTFLAGVFVLACNFAGEILRGIIDRRIAEEIFQ